MTRSFPDLVFDHNVARLGVSPESNDAAGRLPLEGVPDRPYAGDYAVTNPSHSARIWTAAIADAARELHNLVTIHDNGGTASSPKKIKRAARHLLRLLGEESA